MFQCCYGVGLFYIEILGGNCLREYDFLIFPIQIGFVFQAFNLVNEISVLENACMPLGYAGIRKKERVRA